MHDSNDYLDENEKEVEPRRRESIANIQTASHLRGRKRMKRKDRTANHDKNHEGPSRSEDMNMNHQ